MKCWVLLIIAASANDLRTCGPKNDQVKDSGNLEFTCRRQSYARQSKMKDLNKRCRVQCNGGERVGPKKFYCDEAVGWIALSDPTTPINTSAIRCKY